jgi:hypothetical protein
LEKAGSMSGDDPNDTLIRGGPDAVRNGFDNIVRLRPKGFIFHGDEAVVAPPMLVKRLLPFSGICFIAGQSSAGKTFLGVHLAVCLSTGKPFFDREVAERVGVAIVAAEGAGMIGARIAAARSNLGIEADIRLPIAWTGDVPQLKDESDVKRFGASLGMVAQQLKREHDVRLGAVIIDTLVSTFALQDEDNNSEAARTTKLMAAMGRATNALIIPVHHYGKSVTTGLRGGSAWRGGADVVLSVLADRDEATGDVKNRRLAIAKARDGDEGIVSGFALRWMQLGLDRDNIPFGSCYVDPTAGGGAGTQAAAATRAKMDQSERLFRDAFAEVCEVSGVPLVVRGDGPTVKAVRISDLADEFKIRYGTGEGDPKKREEAARGAWRRALKKMLERHFCTESRDDVEWIWAVS